MGLRCCIAALLLLAAGCRSGGPPAPASRIDARLAGAISRDSVVLAGLRPVELRGTPVYQWLAARVPAVAEARQILAGFDGKRFSVSALGASGLQVLNGEPTAGPAPADLLVHGDALAAEGQIWAVVRGRTVLPLSGNAANLNRFLKHVEYATLSGDLRAGLRASLRGYCRTPADATDLEQTLRAFLTLARAAGRERVETTLERQENTVTVRLTASPEQAAKMLAALLR
jgi:hypothetical protein